MTQELETVEAVIISGPRRGEIVRLPASEIAELSDEDIQLLNAALDDVIAAIDRVSNQVRTAIEAFRERPVAA